MFLIIKLEFSNKFWFEFKSRSATISSIGGNDNAATANVNEPSPKRGHT